MGKGKIISKIKKTLIFLILISLFLPGLATARDVDRAKLMFDWTERNYPDYFSPAGQQTFLAEDFLIRYYPDTTTYIGILDENIFLYGEVFGGLIYVGQISDYITYPPLQFSVSSLQPYLPIITTGASLGYAIYQNDGDITTGLLMRTLNPTGAILKSEEYEIGLLKNMVGTLKEIESRLDDIDATMNTMLLKMELDKTTLLKDINNPKDAIDSISNYSQELYELGIKCDESGACHPIQPHQADQNRLDAFAAAVLSFGNDGVRKNLTSIQSAITGSSGSTPILQNFTDNLITAVAGSTKTDKYMSAYQALEQYTMELIGAETRGADLLVDAHLYKNEQSAAQVINNLLQDNIRSVVSLPEPDEPPSLPSQSSFLYNTIRLMLSFADPYYDAPGHDGHFLPDEAVKIFKQAEFLHHRFVNEPRNSVEIIQNPYVAGGKAYRYAGVTVVVYHITEAGEPVPELKMKSLGAGSNCTCEPSKVSTYLITGKGYDNWQGSKLKYSNQYQLSIYEFQSEVKGGYYVYGDGINSTAIETQAYNPAMEPDLDGEILYGFTLITKRNSSRFSGLKWHECIADIDHQYRAYDSLFEAIEDGNYDSYLATDPLSSGVWIKTTCDEWDNGDCINMNSDDPRGDISICSSFTYDGDDTRSPEISVKLYRKMNMDSDIKGKTDGDVWGKIELYIYDEDAETSYKLYENEHQHIQGWHYKYEDTSTFSTHITLIPEHKYYLRLHMRASIEQGLMNTAGYFYLKIQAKEPIRFIFDE